MLRGMGFSNNTPIFLASGKIYQPERNLAPLRKMFPLLYTKESLATAEELAEYQVWLAFNLIKFITYYWLVRLKPMESLTLSGLMEQKLHDINNTRSIHYCLYHFVSFNLLVVFTTSLFLVRNITSLVIVITSENLWLTGICCLHPWGCT